MRVPFLGSLPFDPGVVKTGDEGRPLAASGAQTPFVAALEQVLHAIVDKL
jgi:hypothetical protein